MSHESERTPVPKTREQASQGSDPTTQAINSLDQKVRISEANTMEALRQRWETVGTSALKIAAGAATVSDAIFHNIGFLSSERPDIFLALLGAGAVVWGIKDAGEIPERFRRARELAADSRFLRAALTRNTADVIDQIPFRKLE